jgi:16S rRNA (cytidine1402-2'-O)-methyltransferase
VIRELTKIYEEIIRGTIGEVSAVLKGRTVKGEIVIVIEGKPDKKHTESGDE